MLNESKIFMVYGCRIQSYFTEYNTFELFSHGNKNIYWLEDSGVSLTTEGTSQYQILD